MIIAPPRLSTQAPYRPRPRSVVSAPPRFGETSKKSNMAVFFGLLAATFLSAFGLDSAMKRPEPSNPAVAAAARHIESKRNDVNDAFEKLQKLNKQAEATAPLAEHGVTAMQTVVHEIINSSNDSALKQALSNLPPLTPEERQKTADIMLASRASDRSLTNYDEMHRIFREWTMSVLKPHLQGDMTEKTLTAGDEIFKDIRTSSSRGSHLDQTILASMQVVSQDAYNASGRTTGINLAKEKALQQAEVQKSVSYYLSQIEYELIQQNSQAEWAKAIQSLPDLTDKEKQQTLELFQREDQISSPKEDKKRFASWVGQVVEPRVGHQKALEIVQASDDMFDQIAGQQSSGQWLKASAWGTLMLVFGGFTVANLLKKKD